MKTLKNVDSKENIRNFAKKILKIKLPNYQKSNKKTARTLPTKTLKIQQKKTLKLPERKRKKFRKKIQ